MNPIYYRILQIGGAFAAVVGVTTMVTDESIASGISELGIGLLGVYMGTVLSRSDRSPEEWPLRRSRAAIGGVVFATAGLAAVILGVLRGGGWMALGAVVGAAFLLVALSAFVLVRRLSQ